MRKNLIFDDTRKGLDIHIGEVEKIEGDIKMCSKCIKVFSIENFYLDKGTIDGLSNNCKKCQSEHTKLYYEQNKEQYIKYAKRTYYRNRLKENKISLKEYERIIKEKNLN